MGRCPCGVTSPRGNPKFIRVGKELQAHPAQPSPYPLNNTPINNITHCPMSPMSTTSNLSLTPHPKGRRCHHPLGQPVPMS